MATEADIRAALAKGNQAGLWEAVGYVLDFGTSIFSVCTTKGDLWGFDTADNRVPVGTDGQILFADSAQSLGVGWKTRTITATSPILIDGTTSATLAADVTVSLDQGAAETLLDQSWSEVLVVGASAGTTDPNVNGRGLLNVGYAEDNSTTPSTSGWLRNGHNFNTSIISGVDSTGLVDQTLMRWGVLNDDELTLGEDTIGRLHLASGGATALRPSGAASDEYTFTDTTFDMLGSAADNVGSITDNSATPASGGVLRMGNNVGGPVWRDVGDSTNIEGMRVNASDELIIGQGSSSSAMSLRTTGNVALRPGGSASDEYTFNATQADWLGSSLLNANFVQDNSATPATGGVLRMGNNVGGPVWMDVAGGTNIEGMRVNGSDQIVVGQGALCSALLLVSAGNVSFRPGGSEQYTFSSSQSDWNDNNMVNLALLGWSGTEATTGDERQPHGHTVYGRNNDNDDNFAMDGWGDSAPDTLVRGDDKPMKVEAWTEVEHREEAAHVDSTWTALAAGHATAVALSLLQAADGSTRPMLEGYDYEFQLHFQCTTDAGGSQEDALWIVFGRYPTNENPLVSNEGYMLSAGSAEPWSTFDPNPWTASGAMYVSPIFTGTESPTLTFKATVKHARVSAAPANP